MPKLIKECKYRQKNGRCKYHQTYCSFLPVSDLSTCPDSGGEVKKTKKGKKK